MLTKSHLETIQSAIALIPEQEALRAIIDLELHYQTRVEPLLAERDRILGQAELLESDEARLGEISKALSELSMCRPSEFGGRFSALDVEVMNVVRRAMREC